MIERYQGAIMGRFSEWLNEEVSMPTLARVTQRPERTASNEVDYIVETQFKTDFSFTILAGDFSTRTMANKGCIVGKSIIMPTDQRLFVQYGLRYDVSEIAQFQVLSEQNRRGMGNVVGWGTLGAVIAGPFAALGLGALAQTNKDWLTFAMTFSDGKRVLGDLKQKHLLQFEFLRMPAQPLDSPVVNK